MQRKTEKEKGVRKMERKKRKEVKGRKEEW